MLTEEEVRGYKSGKGPDTPTRSLWLTFSTVLICKRKGRPEGRGEGEVCDTQKTSSWLRHLIMRLKDKKHIAFVTSGLLMEV